MTALPEYERLECPGLWRERPEAQRRAVVVSFGNASLVLSDERSSRPLSHWSLPALIRRNPGAAPALFAPSEEADEELEIEDGTMVAAIETVQARLEAQRPHPGRLRALLGGAAGLAVLLGAMLWLPGAATRHVAEVTPMAKRTEIGRMALRELTTLTGLPCHSEDGDAALARLSERLEGADEMAVLPEALRGAIRLPGRVVAVGLPLLTAQDTPEVVAGHVIAAELDARVRDPLLDYLDWAGIGTTLRFLLTGNLAQADLEGYGEELLRRPEAGTTPEARAPGRADQLLANFARVGVSSTPYAFSLDPSGETVLGLIEADPFKGAPAPEPVMPDADWVALQAICDR